MERYGDFRSHIKREVDLHKLPLDWMYNTTRNSFLLGCSIGCYQAILGKTTLNWKVYVREMFHYSMPFAAMGLCYAGCTYVVQDLTGKERRINYAIGCLPAIGIFHAWFKNPNFTMSLAPVLLIVATIYAEGRMLGWPNILSSRKVTPGFGELPWFPDWSLQKERKGWTN